MSIGTQRMIIDTGKCWVRPSFDNGNKGWTTYDYNEVVRTLNSTARIMHNRLMEDYILHTGFNYNMCIKGIFIIDLLKKIKVD